MAAENGRENPDLTAQLEDAPHRFDFFQAVRLLERATAWATKASEPRAPVGHDHPADREAVRFRAQPAQSFPASEISQYRGALAGRPAEMQVSFLGLTGPLGVLPSHYTSLVIRRTRAKDFALRDFLDLLNHRTISFFFRAWEKYRLPIRYERSRPHADAEATDLATFALYCLIGLGTEGLRGRSGVADETFLFYAGHFARGVRSAVALERMLEDYFDLPVRVLQAVGQWLSLAPEDCSLLPSAATHQGRNCQLGLNAIAGERVWDVQSRFRVRIGPLTYDQFRAFLPDGAALQPLRELTLHYVGAEVDFDVQLVLRGSAVPECRLICDGPDRPFLGWNTWLPSRRPAPDVDDATFEGAG